MLQQLNIKDFALIEDVEVIWTAGLNVLTGETGAGKSILIDALNVVLGGRIGSSIIRHGAEKASIEAVFKQTPVTAAWLKQQELQSEDSDELVVAREITKSGSRIRINGTLVNANIIQDLRQSLLTIHAQHEARSLLSSQMQLDMLDSLGDASHKKVVEKARTLYLQRKELLMQRSEMQISEDERVRRLEFARFQLHELHAANLSAPDEFDSVTAQCRVLTHVVQLEQYAAVAMSAINGDDMERACAIDGVQQANVQLEKAAELDPTLEPVVESLHTCIEYLSDAAKSIRRYKDTLDTDPEKLAMLNARLDVLGGVRKKYGPELSDAIERMQSLEAEVSKLDNAQAAGQELDEEIARLESDLKEVCSELTNARKALAKGLGNRIQKELADLGMEKCKFEISVTESELTATGQDRIEFLIAPNPGQPLLPVSKIASGGELSRVMLAIKSIFANADQVCTVVFDEIDTGISGKVLQSMRDKLAQLSRSHQILCITHQPMIASIASNHLEVTKLQSESETKVTVSSLQKEDRIKALALMASGQEDAKLALQFANSLYNEGQKLLTQF